MKAYQIFDHFLKDKHNHLLEGQKIPTPKEIKVKRYCRWNYSTNMN